MVVRLLVVLPQNFLGEEGFRQLQETTTHDATTAFVVTAKYASLSLSASSAADIGKPARWAAFFLPPPLTESALHDFKAKDFALLDQSLTGQVSRRLLAMVHPFLAANFALRGIISVQNSDHCPADIIIVDISHAPVEVVDHMLQITNGEKIHSGPEAILKFVVISSISFRSEGDVMRPKFATAAAAPRKEYGIPACPVCLHRIDPTRIGLPPPQNHQLCSKFCPPPNLAYPNHEDKSSCPQQRLFRPWRSPCHCNACCLIEGYWKSELQAFNRDTSKHLRCFRCELEETLWVCLTCGFIGCGRYSNKHSVEHFDETGHPFSLELATLRIWDYSTGYFCHRSDVLDCPSSPPLLYPWVHRRQHGDLSYQNAHWSGMDEMKSPKKASMIGEEYEALLQSALEDQAQHYEGEITRLRSRLTEDAFDKSTMSPQEADEITVLQAEIASLRTEISRCSRELLEWQARESRSQRRSKSLLGEQKVAQDLLTTIKEEAAKEHIEGSVQVEELEQQIADLTANQNMRRQFSQDEELQQAQIWGMSSEAGRAKRGKKAKRGYRK